MCVLVHVLLLLWCAMSCHSNVASAIVEQVVMPESLDGNTAHLEMAG